MKRLSSDNSLRGLPYFYMQNFIVTCIIFMIIAIIAQGTAQAETEGKEVIGGQEAQAGAYPWMVSLVETDKKDAFWAQYCGGTLIHPQLVLTAAHCTYDYGREITASEISVIVGETELRAGTDKRMAIEKIIRHPSYDNSNGDADLALLKLVTPSTQPILKIADSSMIDIDQTEALGIVLGWGRTKTNIRVNHLQQVDVPLVTAQTCTDAYESIGYDMTDNMLCAGYQKGGKDACSGDSGGPLIIHENEDDETSRWVQVGVISWGKGCAQANAYGVYTHVARFQGWINVQTALNISINYSSTASHNSGTTTTIPVGQYFKLKQAFLPIAEKSFELDIDE